MSILTLNQYSYSSIDYRYARKYLFVDKPCSSRKVAMSCNNLTEFPFLLFFLVGFFVIVFGFFNNELEI